MFENINLMLGIFILTCHYSLVGVAFYRLTRGSWIEAPVLAYIFFWPVVAVIIATDKSVTGTSDSDF